MKKLCLLALVLVSTFGFAKKDHPVIEERKQFAAEYQQVLERAGWPLVVTVTGKGKDVLQIWMPNAAVDAMYSFEKDFVESSKESIKAKGFQTVEIKTDVFSANFPKGIWDITL